MPCSFTVAVEQIFTDMKQLTVQQPTEPRSKEPWLAVNLSLLFPGTGQIYAGKVLKGIVILFGEIILFVQAVWSIFSPFGNTVNGLMFFLPITGIYLFNLFDAYNSVKKYSFKRQKPLNKSPNYKSFSLYSTSSLKEPWLAVFLSQLLPGLGHFYLEKFIWGGFLLICIIIFANLASLFSVFLAFPPIICALASYHAYMAAPQKSERSKLTIVFVVAAILAVKLAIAYLPTWVDRHVAMFEIPSNSMQPTLLEGDKILVNKSNNYLPQKGDIVVFKLSLSPNQKNEFGSFFVKRIIGTPGQKVEIKNGVVYVNNKPQEEYYIAEAPDYTFGPIIVPNDTYLVLGDNRNDSYDSHVWGFLPAANIIGKAYKIYWPPERIRALN